MSGIIAMVRKKRQTNDCLRFLIFLEDPCGNNFVVKLVSSIKIIYYYYHYARTLECRLHFIQGLYLMVYKSVDNRNLVAQPIREGLIGDRLLIVNILN